MNNTFFDPLWFIAHGGNVDVKWMQNTIGAAEYIASYVSKAEAPDQSKLTNIFIKKISQMQMQDIVTDQSRLKAAAQAIIESTKVGSVQACYVLLHLKMVKTDVTVVTVNPSERKFLTHVLISDAKILNTMEPEDSVITAGPASVIGKRNIYHSLSEQQKSINNGVCNVTFYSFMTSLKAKSATKKEILKFKPPPVLSIDSNLGMLLRLIYSSFDHHFNNLLTFVC